MNLNARKKIIIVGGGAAGYFAANQLLEQFNGVEIIILEQGQNVLQKVKVSGGGRCNVTNALIEREQLKTYYPRGWKLLRKLFSSFSNYDTISWFNSKNVELKTEADNRMFPTTNNSQTIINALRSVEDIKHLKCYTSCKVVDFKFSENQWEVETLKNGKLKCDFLIIATGSSPTMYQLLAKKGVKIVPTVPSLFTFNIPNDVRLLDIPGISVPSGRARIIGEKQISTGPILITHWGLSGPAILKLSSWEAKILHDKKYNFQVAINWVDTDVEDCRIELNQIIKQRQNKKVVADAAFKLPKRLWKKITTASKINEDQIWKSLSKKQVNTLIEQLTNAIFNVEGKSTFKKEFVTCGGVSLHDVHSKTLAHKTLENLYFAGEVLDIDAITGGYNFQAAWTTAFVTSQSIINAIENSKQ